MQYQQFQGRHYNSREQLKKYRSECGDSVYVIWGDVDFFTICIKERKRRLEEYTRFDPSFRKLERIAAASVRPSVRTTGPWPIAESDEPSGFRTLCRSEVSKYFLPRGVKLFSHGSRGLSFAVPDAIINKKSLQLLEMGI